jgi:hypothetical protein
MSCGGTIRCKHGAVMRLEKENDSMVVLSSENHFKNQPPACPIYGGCTIELPVAVYENIKQGCNFTHVFLSDEATEKEYKKEHADLFNFVGCCSDQTSNGLKHLVF